MSLSFFSTKLWRLELIAVFLLTNKVFFEWKLKG